MTPTGFLDKFIQWLAAGQPKEKPKPRKTFKNASSPAKSRKSYGAGKDRPQP